MRLIDANELMEHATRDKLDSRELIFQMIENAPTIKPNEEHEAVEPIPPADKSDLWRCGYCHHQILRCSHQKYCSYCGRAVKWGG